MNIFELEAVLRLNSSEYKKGIDDAKKGATQVGDEWVSAGAKTTQAGYAIESVSRPARSLIQESIGLAQEWEYGISKVSAISGLTGEELEGVKNKAAEVAKATKWNMSEAAEALEYMAMAGWKDQQMIGGLEPIMKLAAATGADLGSTSDIVTDAMTAFGMRAGETQTVLRDGMEVELENTARFADVLAAAASNSNTNVAMLGESFKYAAPIAGSMGYSIEDVAIALGTMANSGVKASMGGTALRTVITNLAKPTSNVTAALNQLGISQEDLIGENVSLMDIMTQLRGAFQGGNLSAEEYTSRMRELEAQLESGELSYGSYEAALQSLDESYANGQMTAEEYEKQLAEIEEQYESGELESGSYTEALNALNTEMYGVEASNKAALAAMIAGKYGMAGFLAIVNSSDEDFNMLTDAIYGSTDATKIMYDTMMGSTEGASARLDSALNVLKTSLGETMLPYVTQFLEAITNVVNKFGELDPAAQKTIMVGLGIVGVLGPILIYGGKLISGIGSLITVLGGIGGGAATAATAIGGVGTAAAAAGGAGGIGALIAAAGPILIGGAVVAGIVAAVVLIVKNWDKIKEKAKEVGEWVSDKWNEIKEATSKKWGEIKDSVNESWENLKQNTSESLENMRNNIHEKWENIKTSTSEAWDNLKNKVSDAWDNMKSKNTESSENIRSTISQKWEETKSNTSETWDNIKEKLADSWEKMKTNTETTTKNIKDDMASKWENVKNDTRDKWDNMKDKVRESVENMRTESENKITALKNNMESTFNGLKGAATEWGTGITNNLSGALNNGIGWIQGAVSSISTSISGGLSGLISSAFSWGSDLMANLSQGIWQKMHWVTDAASSVANSIKSFLGFSEPERGPLSNFHTYAPDMMKLFAEGVEKNTDIVTDQIAKSFDFSASISAPANTPYSVQGMNRGNITVNVYAKDQDVNELAEIVVDKIVNESSRRLYAFG